MNEQAEEIVVTISFRYPTKNPAEIADVLGAVITNAIASGGQNMHISVYDYEPEEEDSE
jgi:hypothetical protein